MFMCSIQCARRLTYSMCLKCIIFGVSIKLKCQLLENDLFCHQTQYLVLYKVIQFIALCRKCHAYNAMALYDLIMLNVYV